MEFVEVDGSRGEGGGQILRAAVAFSAILRQPVKVDNIRAGREVPGLKRQHVSALEVLAEVFGGELRGAREGSSSITFVPSAPRVHAVSIDMGTAASVTLVLQAVVPAVALNRAQLSLELVGGTDVPWSPTLDYLDCVVKEAFASAGIRFGLRAPRRGYYPRGGGMVSAAIEPCARLRSLDSAERRSVRGVKLVSRCGSLPRHVAERQAASASRVLESAGIPTLGSEVAVEESASPGSSFLCYCTEGGAYLGSDAIGARGKRAEDVGLEAAERFVAVAKSGAALDSNLADMLLPLMSMAETASRVRIPEVTEHLRSGLDLAAQFTCCRWSAAESDGATVVTVEPRRA